MIRSALLSGEGRGEAVARYEEVLKLDPMFEPAMVSSALIRANRGEANEATTRRK